jgi:hypothetical protein
MGLGRLEKQDVGFWRFSLDVCRRLQGISLLKEFFVFTLNKAGGQWEIWTKRFVKVKFKNY